MSVYHYPVRKDWIPYVPKNPYADGIGAYRGVVLHYTENEQDTAASESQYEHQNWQSAFVHEFVDHKEVVQTADPNYRCWGCGAKGNPYYVQIEKCSSHSQSEFDTSFDAWCERAAEYLYRRKLGVIPANDTNKGVGATLLGHFQISKYMGGTDHTDPLSHLAKWNKTWDDVVNRVKAIYNALAAEEVANQAAAVENQRLYLTNLLADPKSTYGTKGWAYSQLKTLPISTVRSGDSNTVVKELQAVLTYLGFNCNGIDGIFGNGTYNAVIAFQRQIGLIVDGVVGNSTWAALFSY
jgi:hypothetical protein